MTYHTTAHNLTMDWSISLNRWHKPVIHGYINGEPRFSCELTRNWTPKQAEKLVVVRLHEIAHQEARDNLFADRFREHIW